MKQDELMKILEEYEKSGIDAEFRKLEVFADTFNYDEIKTIGKVIISVDSDAGNFLDSINQFSNNIEVVYKYFQKIERLSSYVRKPSLLINGEVDDAVDIGVSDIDSNGLVNMFFRKGLNLRDHMDKTYNNISFSSDIVFLIELEKEE